MAAQLPFSNDGSFFEQFQKLQQAQNAGAAATPPEPQAAQASTSVSGARDGNSNFRPSAGWTGAQPGYIFTRGPEGQGYYKDVGLEGKEKQRQEQAKAKPVALKANKTIAKVPAIARASGGDPPAKKSKKDAAEASKPKYLREMEKYKEMACGDGTSHDRPLVK